MSQSVALIIDDNAKNVSVLAHLLSDEGVQSVHVTDTGRLESVLETIDSVNMVFLDLEMPNRNGFDVLQWLKGDDRFQNVPVVAYTVHISEINTAHARGFDGFIAKPLDPDRFPGQLARILRREAVWESA